MPKEKSVVKASEVERVACSLRLTPEGAVADIPCKDLKPEVCEALKKLARDILSDPRGVLVQKEAEKAEGGEKA